MLLVLFFATIASAVTLNEQNLRLSKTNKILLQTLQEMSGESEVSVSADCNDDNTAAAAYHLEVYETEGSCVDLINACSVGVVAHMCPSTCKLCTHETDNCEGYMVFMQLRHTNWCSKISPRGKCGIGNGVVFGSAYGCRWRPDRSGYCHSSILPDECTAFLTQDMIQCSAAEATYQELGGLLAHDVAVVTYTRGWWLTTIEKDASCCIQCAARSDCEYWVRDTFSSQCWLKSNSGNDILSMNHPHRRGGIKAGKRVYQKSAPCFHCGYPGGDFGRGGFGRRLLTEEK